MPVDNSGLNYVTIEKFIEWVSVNFAGLLSNDEPNKYSPSTLPARRVIKESLLNGEARVNSFLKRRGYKVPVESKYEESVAVIRMHVYNIASYELFGRRGITKERYYKYTRTIQDLKDIANGDQPLPDCTTPFRSKTKITYGSNLPSVFSESRREHADRI